MLQRIHDVLSSISRAAVWIGGGALMLCAIMITGDVLCRKFLRISIGGSDEITAYVFSASTTWAFSYCLMHRANIRIDAVYNLLPKGGRAIIDLLSIILLSIFVVSLTKRAVSTLTESVVNQSTSITPLGTRMWIPQSFWVAGWVFFSLTLLFVLVYLAVSMFRHDLDRINSIAGIRTVDEEISEETRGTLPMHRNAQGDEA